MNRAGSCCLLSSPVHACTYRTDCAVLRCEQDSPITNAGMGSSLTAPLHLALGLPQPAVAAAVAGAPPSTSHAHAGAADGHARHGPGVPQLHPSAAAVPSGAMQEEDVAPSSRSSGTAALPAAAAARVRGGAASFILGTDADWQAQAQALMADGGGVVECDASLMSGDGAFGGVGAMPGAAPCGVVRCRPLPRLVPFTTRVDTARPSEGQRAERAAPMVTLAAVALEAHSGCRGACVRAGLQNPVRAALALARDSRAPLSHGRLRPM